MGFKEAYRFGQERKALEVTAQEYDAWPKGMISCGFSITEDIGRMTAEVRETAQQKAEEIKIPRNLLDRIGFHLGYFVGPRVVITNLCTSDGPVNPFTGKVLYQR